MRTVLKILKDRIKNLKDRILEGYPGVTYSLYWLFLRTGRLFPFERRLCIGQFSIAKEKKTVELWVLFWLFIEVVAFILTLICANFASFAWIVVLLSVYRLASIFRVWFTVFILSPPEPASKPRLIILTLINYAEIVITFAVIAFVSKGSFGTEQQTSFRSGVDSLRYSVGVATSLGSHFEPTTWLGYIIMLFQIMYVIIFITTVIQIAVSSSKQVKE